jgi:uncharacterized membrane-anchored protein
MKPFQRVVVPMLLLALCSAHAQEQPEETSPLDEFDWVLGPATVDIARRAEIDLPEGYTYLDSDDTEGLMALMQNPTSTEEYFFAPEDLRWWAVFSYEDSGYIRDDDEIDAAELLKAIREGNRYANEERRQRGWPELRINGWQYPPFYETDTNRLAWAILGESEGVPFVNYNTRLLGRTGVMSAILVADPEQLDDAVVEFKAALSGFRYKAGQRYAEFRPGDKVAAYGLAALVAGGGAAALTKSGLGKSLFKFLGLAAVAVFAALGSFIKRLFGRRA